MGHETNISHVLSEVSMVPGSIDFEGDQRNGNSQYIKLGMAPMGCSWIATAGIQRMQTSRETPPLSVQSLRPAVADTRRVYDSSPDSC